MRIGHLLRSQLDHTRREILTIDRAFIFVQLRCERSDAEADVQNNRIGLFYDCLINGSRRSLVSSKGIRISLVGQSYTRVVTVRPEVKSFLIQHSSPFALSVVERIITFSSVAQNAVSVKATPHRF